MNEDERDNEDHNDDHDRDHAPRASEMIDELLVEMRHQAENAGPVTHEMMRRLEEIRAMVE